MTNEEALTLAKQGFTADEIKALGWSAENNANPVPPEPAPLHTGSDGLPNDPPSDPIPPEDKPNEVENTLKALTDTVASLSETVKAMQISNQKTAKKSKNDGPKSADEVIKGFIENM